MEGDRYNVAFNNDNNAQPEQYIGKYSEFCSSPLIRKGELFEAVRHQTKHKYH